MDVKIEIILNENVVHLLKDIEDANRRVAAVRDVLLSSANELVVQIAESGLEEGTTITKHVGVTLNGKCTRETGSEVGEVQNGARGDSGDH